MAEVDRLEIAVATNARKANTELDSLITRLNAVNTALRSVNSGGLDGLANSVRTLSSSMQTMKSVGSADFTRLSKNIQKLSSINAGSLERAAVSMNTIASSMNNLGAVSENAVKIGEVASSLSKLGGAGVQKAITAIPALTTELHKMMTTLATAPKVSSNLISMTNAMANLASQGSKVGNTAKSLQGRFSGFSLSANKATGSSKSLASAIGTLYAKFWLLQRAATALWSAANSSMDFLETVNYYQVAMRQIGDDNASLWSQYGYDSAESYAESFSTRMDSLNEKMTGFAVDENGNTTSTGSKSLGININDILNTEAVYGQMTNSLGLAGETAINTSKALTMLGADWASLRNISFDTAWEKFASALSGQSRAVRSLGIDITQATLQEYAYRYGISESVANMNQAEKTQLRLLAILDQSKVAYGDLANTISSPSNQLRLLSNNFQTLARTIGNLFVPVLQNVLPYINALVIAMQKLFEWVGDLIGIDFSSINSSIGGASDGMQDVIDGTDDETDALNDATKAATKLKNVTSGIDELNVLNYDSGSSSSSGTDTSTGGNSLLDDAISTALAEYEATWDAAFDRMNNKSQELADNIVKAFATGNYTGIGTYLSNGISGALNSIKWENVYSVARTFGTGFAQFLNGLITPKLFDSVGTTIASTLNTAIYAALSFGKELNWTQMGTAIGTGVNSFFNTFDFKALAETLNTWVDGLEVAIGTAISTITWSDVFEGIDIFLQNLDIDTLTVAIGAIAWMHGGKELTISVLKSLLGTQIGLTGKAGGKTISLAATLAIVVTVAVEGFNLGKEIGKALFPGDEEYYNNFKWIGDGGFFDSVKDYATDGLLLDDIINSPTGELGQSIGNGVVNSPTGKLGKSIGNLVLNASVETPDLKQTISDIKDKVHEFWGLNVKLPVHNYLETKKKDISEWWSNVKDWWGDKYLDIKNKLATVRSDLSSWWNEKLVPWWGNKYLGVKNKLATIKSEVTAWWNDKIVPWWGNKALKVNNKFETAKKDVAEWWDNVKAWWGDKYLSVKNSFDTAKTNVENWWSNVTSWWGDKYLSIKTNISGIKEAWNTLANDINSKLTIKIDTSTTLGKALSGLFGTDNIKLGNLPTFQTGGFPEDGLFMANSTELVGKFSNGKTAVANNGQIIEGIKAGVIDGLMEVEMAKASSSSENGGSINLELPMIVDGKEIARASYKGFSSLVRSGEIKPQFT